jgi:hypothetical protein
MPQSPGECQGFVYRLAILVQIDTEFSFPYKFHQNNIYHYTAMRKEYLRVNKTNFGNIIMIISWKESITIIDVVDDVE